MGWPLLSGTTDRIGSDGLKLHWRRGWILGGLSSQREWLGNGTGCPRGWWSHCPWRCARTVEMLAPRDVVMGMKGWAGVGLGNPSSSDQL